MLMFGDPNRLGTLVYVVTMETSRPAQERHTHLRSYPGNQMHVCVFVCVCMYVFYTSVDVPVVSGKSRITRACVCVCIILQHCKPVALYVVTVET
jgi:hypothetical protein